jgi:imidazolonepropionase-like amidohydrolase
MYGFTARTEIEAMRRLGIWSDDELLRLWFTDTPRSIFPRRKVGRLADGYEASFLVLNQNPFEKLEAIDDIRLRVKQGCLLK